MKKPKSLQERFERIKKTIQMEVREAGIMSDLEDLQRGVEHCNSRIIFESLQTLLRNIQESYLPDSVKLELLQDTSLFLSAAIESCEM